MGITEKENLRARNFRCLRYLHKQVSTHGDPDVTSKFLAKWGIMRTKLDLQCDWKNTDPQYFQPASMFEVSQLIDSRMEAWEGNEREYPSYVEPPMLRPCTPPGADWRDQIVVHDVTWSQQLLMYLHQWINQDLYEEKTGWICSE